MNTTFTQKYTREVPITGLSKEQFLSLAVETTKTLGWAFGNITETGFTAYTANGVFNWNAEVKLNVNDNAAKFISQSRGTRSIEHGKDKINLENFLATFNAIKNSKMSVEMSSAYMHVA